MARILLLMTAVLALGAATLSLQSCGSEAVEAAPPEAATSALVTLPDGSTMAAASGSLTREMADWLASREGQSRTFTFHGFEEDRPKLTSIGLGRAADLATVLRAPRRSKSPATKPRSASSPICSRIAASHPNG